MLHFGLCLHTESFVLASVGWLSMLPIQANALVARKSTHAQRENHQISLMACIL